MYRTYRQSLFEHFRALLKDKFQVEISRLAVEEPPNVALGDYALPIAFELARTLRKAPRKIAEEIVAAIGDVPGFAGFEVAGAGYINSKLDRSAMAREFARHPERGWVLPYFPLIEHTSINPNKAAHIGHLRNAILGDTLARMLRAGVDDASPNTVGVQNYIDNTGVQVADVMVALTHLEGMEPGAIDAWMQAVGERGERIDFVCWDLYARVSQWYEAEPGEKEARRKIRLDTLHAIEEGGNAIAGAADRLSTAIVHRHLETMQRLGIQYDFLPRESEVLHLHFWDAAFSLMQKKGVLYKEEAGKNEGCWVMRRAGTEGATGEGPDEEAKVIVRSNKENPEADGTVTYVGKDIAYHLWKFGKLPGKNFYERPFYGYPDGKTCDISCMPEAADPTVTPSHFGKADAIYNVIDSRQADPQNNVIEALRGMGFTDAANNYHHFSYEMVALTPRCAMDLGYAVSEEDRTRPFIEVSGRKGFGVKADDLIDKLIAAAKTEVDARHPARDENERTGIATKIAVGALRYSMLRYTRNTIIAFDFQDALNFEGETGPYAQYAAVRAASLFRKGEQNNDPLFQEAKEIISTLTSPFMQQFGLLQPSNMQETILRAFSARHAADCEQYFTGEDGDSLWELWLLASKSVYVLESSIQTTEPAYLAKHAFQLAQQFSNFYHRHPILTESDPTRKMLLLATAAVAQRELVRVLGWMGIDVPEAM